MVLLTSFRPPRATASSPPPACRAHATASLLAARALAAGSSLAARAHATSPPPTRRAHAPTARWRPRTRSPPPPGSPPVRAPPPFLPIAAHHRLLPARCSLPHPRHRPGLAAQPVHHAARESHHGLFPYSRGTLVAGVARLCAGADKATSPGISASLRAMTSMPKRRRTRRMRTRSGRTPSTSPSPATPWSSEISGRVCIESRGSGASNKCFSWFAISAAFCRIRGSFRKNLHCILIIQQWKRLLLSDSFGFGMSSLVIFRCYFGVLFLLSKSSRLLDVDYANSSKL